ncbi:MAG: hypothetical protein R3320_01425 [Nitriliruptorales bacterium]|nr:hypothetical protein [Nitriliruptorales bacterium]
MAVDSYPGRVVGRADAGAGVAFAGLTLLTHLANLAFVIVGARLLTPGDFGNLTAILGIVLVGMAPAMAIQSLTAAGALGRPVSIDRPLAWRLAATIGVIVAVVMGVAAELLELDGTIVVPAVAVAGAALPLTAMSEGLLQGHARFVALGSVMAFGAGTKLTLGALGMSLSPTLAAAALAIASGYVVQASASRIRSRELAPVSPRIPLTTPVVYAVVLMAGLLALVHLDAVIAPAILGELESGRYGVGVVAIRITFWLPQFAVLLLFPRLVRYNHRRVVGATFTGVAVLGLFGAGAAFVIGPTFAELGFGSRLAAVGPELWRFVLVGAMLLGLQFLALLDLATGRRHALWLIGAAAVTIGIWLPVSGAGTAAQLVTHVMAVLAAFFVAGVGIALAASKAVSPT